MASSSAQNDEYWPIHIARSDGQGYAQLDHVALRDDEEQDVAQRERWEVIVAGHLQNQIGPKDDKRQYKLADFPKGYELRCAVRTQAGTRDYYLYGHPAGPKAHYRTPGEFALHALWLISDSTDNSQCPCDLCSKYLEKAKQELAKTQAAPTQTQFPAPTPTQQPQYQQPQHQAPPGTTGWTNVFRVGELIWYKHAAWRLGVVLAITPKPGTPLSPGASDSSYHFTLAPLGHALLQQASIVKDCQFMRPFLTFSVPNTAMDELKDKTFETVDWPALAARYTQEPDPSKREVNRQILGLEASKMGARTINDAFSTFDLLRQGATPDGALYVQHYRGIYLGTEMVFVGDPVRVASDTQPTQQLDHHQSPSDANLNLVMLITEIQVLTPSSPPGARPTLQFKGNLYRTIRVPANNTTPNNLPQGLVPVPAESLGPAFVEELATRNAIERDNSMCWTWALVAAADQQQGVLRPEHDVLGRFYVTEKLMSVIDPPRLQAWVQRGLLEEAPAYLNNRGHSGGGIYVGRRAGRKATLGEAVGVEFSAPVGIVEN
ncbi:hypothetical protein N657DRAFT_643354 [Parathielavia appendiculata]|uniref:Cryptic loci regulator 2 N-terminal domain-containing protein n=1 Tax=Parathielavia appendiculata TaxID=2587402 RepID=A0AAN6U4Z8_9PEZI|nr:hypothetical protein N657DRAFT_643354 [Parathielavia appendiculata]